MKSLFGIILITLLCQTASAGLVAKNCFKFLETEFEDGAAYYHGFDKTVLTSLKGAGMNWYAAKLEEDVVMTGQKSFAASDCKKIQVAEYCRKLTNTYFDDSASYNRGIGIMLIMPLEKMGEKTLAKYLESALVLKGHAKMSKNICSSMTEAIY